ncbi:16S rRNA (uracil(1498)-N(3))-methyltransferase [Janthinobacterium sp. 17J80-10]|uniref:16S rRNA (uracil(1498)-N(3))-methyltransferase n=1 Tax=Janthinobacterium sp. 17J80-10 TaxID=2497863 RepID=UPI0010056229|nr:16S rRNA (uracil(1498)-N(3))-methyltransferase [Janthinobacterium sp. 17J80-10]QAU35302.1 16S rRNA (uracil(1498)-N(3))-methyltransferase [Janthinobacterium sp. 17J80-10]
MPRFFCDQPLAIGQVISLPDAVARHVQVLRLAPGDTLTLFNGEGGEYAATLLTLDKRGATAEIQAFSPREAELSSTITLAQALPEGAKMDWIIEKAVELGVTGVQPLAAQRCVVRLAADRAQKKLQHWQGVAVAAAEQSGRNRVSRIADIADFRSWIAQPGADRRILLSPRAEISLTNWARAQPPQPLTLIVGPEGGLSKQEEDDALKHGALALSMGSRILRTETAGMAALAALNALWGEM